MLFYWLLFLYVSLVASLSIWNDFGTRLRNIHYYNARLTYLDWSRGDLLWKSDVYSESMAVFLLECSMISSLVYTESIVLRKPKEFKRMYVLRGLNYYKRSSTIGFAGYTRDKQNLVVVVKSTANLSDVLTASDTSVVETGDGKIHRGFWFQALEVLPSILDILFAVPTLNTVYLAGHSLGGAVASVLFCQLKEIFPSKIFSCYTYASPKVCDEQFKKFIKSGRVFHHLNKSDPVIYKPKLSVYRRFGNEIYHTVDTGNDNVNHGIKVYLECVRKVKESKIPRRTTRWDETFSRWVLDMLGG